MLIETRENLPLLNVPLLYQSGHCLQSDGYGYDGVGCSRGRWDAHLPVYARGLWWVKGGMVWLTTPTPGSKEK